MTAPAITRVYGWATDAPEPWQTANPTTGRGGEFPPAYLNEWMETAMGEKLCRVEVRIDDRIHYSQDVESVDLTHTEGVLSLVARAPGCAARAAEDNPLLPPPPIPGAPDEDLTDEPSADQPTVLERVHTGEEYSKLADQPTTGRGRGRKGKAAAESDLPPGAVDVTDLVFGDEVPPATVTVDGVEVPPTGIGYRPDDAPLGEAIHLPTGTVMDGVILNLEPSTVADLVTETTLPVDDEPESTEA